MLCMLKGAPGQEVGKSSQALSGNAERLTYVLPEVYEDFSQAAAEGARINPGKAEANSKVIDEKIVCLQ